MAKTKLTTITLGGRLGKLFGKTFKLDVRSPAEAVVALCSMIPGFQAELMKSNTGYRVRMADEEIPEQGLHLPAAGRQIRITPVVRGSKNGGLFQVIMGAALIVASFYAPMLAGTIGAKAAGALGTVSLGFGASLAIGGVIQLISPQQRGLATKDSPENGASYNFNGPVNTTRQGGCTPLAYGQVYAGSTVATAGIYAEDQA